MHPLINTQTTPLRRTKWVFLKCRLGSVKRKIILRMTTYLSHVELVVMVAPVHSTVQVGSPVRLECAVFGNLIENIQWARDIEDKITDKVRNLPNNGLVSVITFRYTIEHCGDQSTPWEAGVQGPSTDHQSSENETLRNIRVQSV